MTQWLTTQRLDDTVKACLSGIPQQKSPEPEWWERLEVLVAETCDDYGIDDPEIHSALKAALCRAMNEARAHGLSLILNRFLAVETLDEICLGLLEKEFRGAE